MRLRISEYVTSMAAAAGATRSAQHDDNAETLPNLLMPTRVAQHAYDEHNYDGVWMRYKIPGFLVSLT